MTADGTPGSNNQPQFLGSGAPATAPDLNTISNYAAKVGGYRRDTDAERLNATGRDLFEGLLWWTTDTRILWLYENAGWIPVLSDAIAFNPTITGLTLGNGTRGGHYWWIGAGLVFLRAWVKLGSTSAITGSLSLATPVNADPTVAAGQHDAGMDARVNRGGVFFAPLGAFIDSPASIGIWALATDGANLGYRSINSTTPGTWGDGALLTIAGTYKAVV